MQSKAVLEETCHQVRNKLLAGSERHQRIARQIIVMRLLGLRHEEARKVNSKDELLEDGRNYILAGTKGGRGTVYFTSQLRSRSQS